MSKKIIIRVLCSRYYTLFYAHVFQYKIADAVLDGEV